MRTIRTAWQGPWTWSGLVLSIALAALACAEEPRPLFSDDFSQVCNQLRLARERAGRPRSVVPDQIAWAATLDEAFARAKREDKPVLLATLVRENGDPACDV